MTVSHGELGEEHHGSEPSIIIIQNYTSLCSSVHQLCAIEFTVWGDSCYKLQPSLVQLSATTQCVVSQNGVLHLHSRAGDSSPSRQQQQPS